MKFTCGQISKVFALSKDVSKVESCLKERHFDDATINNLVNEWLDNGFDKLPTYLNELSLGDDSLDGRFEEHLATKYPDGFEFLASWER